MDSLYRDTEKQRRLKQDVVEASFALKKPIEEMSI